MLGRWASAAPNAGQKIWDVIGPMLDQVLAQARATWSENLFLVLNRGGYSEECYFTFTISPVADEFETIAGVFCAVAETTATWSEVAVWPRCGRWVTLPRTPVTQRPPAPPP